MFDDKPLEDQAITRIKILSREGFKNSDAITASDLEFIQTCVDSNNDELIARAYWAIGQIGIKAPNKIEQMITNAYSDLKHKNNRVRENALFAIGRTGRTKTSLVESRIDEIITLYKDECPKVRLAMIWACENIANTRPELFKDSIHIFEELLEDADEKHVRAEAPEIFRVIGKNMPELVQRSLPKLEQKRNDPNRVVRIHASGAIRIIKKNL